MKPSLQQLEKAVELLKNGKVIIIPTDTVYAFATDASHPNAVKNLAEIKNINVEDAKFSLLLSNISMLGGYTKPLSNKVFKFMNKMLPGPFTFILNANGQVTNIFGKQKKTIGIRIPENRITNQLIELLGSPILVTSLHDDDAIIEYTTDPDLIFDRYKNEVGAIINGGFGNNEASTVIDCTSDDLLIKRKGLGKVEELV
jgi:tRNA threonylcarbamoyl adenosine modification protein (Sua5/YciO/YrdC/YwlC family)